MVLCVTGWGRRSPLRPHRRVMPQPRHALVALALPAWLAASRLAAAMARLRAGPAAQERLKLGSVDGEHVTGGDARAWSACAATLGSADLPAARREEEEHRARPGIALDPDDPELHDPPVRSLR